MSETRSEQIIQSFKSAFPCLEVLPVIKPKESNLSLIKTQYIKELLLMYLHITSMTNDRWKILHEVIQEQHLTQKLPKSF